MIPLSVPHLKGNEWKYVKDCLDTGWVSSVGGYVTKFEEAVKNYLGRSYAIACVSGTSALHLALLAAGVAPEDEVIVPALTFIAPANAVKYIGAYPVFVDVEAEHWQIDVAKLADFLIRQCTHKQGILMNRHTKRRVRAIIPVDILGHPCDIDPIMDLAREYGLAVIEDNAESLGSKYKGQPTGAKADVTCLSFNGNKIITAGGGGMVVTNNEAFAKQIRYLSTQAKDDEIEYVHHQIGFNARLSNIQAALGLAQLEVLDEYVLQKRQIAHRYEEAFAQVPGISTLKQASWAQSSFWLNTVLVDEKEFGQDSRRLMARLNAAGIQSRPLWHPLDLLKPFKDCFSYEVRITHELYAKALSLPSSVHLTKQQQERVISTLANRNANHY